MNKISSENYPKSLSKVEEIDNMINYSKELVDALLHERVTVIQLLNNENTNDITDSVREETSELNKQEQEKISFVLNELLLQFYENSHDSKFHKTIKNLDEDSKFLIKENLIYYIGRLGNDDSKEIVSKCYHLETNHLHKMNVAFSACLLGNQEIELDFISKITPGSKYDLIIRSWTMAFFKNVENPYKYVDHAEDDWSAAKKPRIIRLQINEINHKKYNKAMAFRLFDLTVLYNFCKNRSFHDLTDEEYEIIERCISKSPIVSLEKEEKIEEMKRKILSKT